MSQIMPRRSLIAALIGATIAAGGLAGCVVVVGGRGHYHGWAGNDTIQERRTLTVDHIVGSNLDVATSDGSIEVRRRDLDFVEIEATVRSDADARLDEIEVIAERDADDTLRLRVEWPGGVRKSWESCSFLVLVPDAGEVRLDSGDGAVKVFGVGDSIHATTDDGSIELHDAWGPVTARTDDGRITLRQAGPGAPLDLRSGDGAVRVELDPSFTGSLEASSGDGRVSATGLDAIASPVRLETVSSRRIHLSTDDAGPVSTIRTGDGSITISVRGADHQT